MKIRFQIDAFIISLAIFSFILIAGDDFRIVNGPYRVPPPPGKRWLTWVVERNGSERSQPKAYDIATAYPVMSLSNYLCFFKCREVGFVDADIYVCFKKPDGSLTRARNMGACKR